MSREVLGLTAPGSGSPDGAVGVLAEDAPDDGATTTAALTDRGPTGRDDALPRDEEVAPGAAPGDPLPRAGTRRFPSRAGGTGGPGRRSHGGGAVLVVLALAAGALVGWTTSHPFGTTGQAPPATPLPAVATIEDVLSESVIGADAQATVRLRVANAADTAISVTGSDNGFFAAKIDSIAPLPVLVEAGSWVELEAHVTVTCDTTLRLAAPPLTVRRADGAVRSLDIRGSTAALVALCERGDDRAHPLFVTSVGRDADRLKVVVSITNGRTVHLVGIAAGGVALTGRPLPVSLDGPERVIWLDPPRTCAPQWRTQGVPQRLDLTIEESTPGAGTAHIIQPGGVALADWLLASACGGGP